MKVKDNLKEKIKIYENKYFITYKYVFENGNSYRESVSKWLQRDFRNYTLLTPEECLERHLERVNYYNM